MGYCLTAGHAPCILHSSRFIVNSLLFIRILLSVLLDILDISKQGSE